MAVPIIFVECTYTGPNPLVDKVVTISIETAPTGKKTKILLPLPCSLTDAEYRLLRNRNVPGFDALCAFEYWTNPKAGSKTPLMQRREDEATYGVFASVEEAARAFHAHMRRAFADAPKSVLCGNDIATDFSFLNNLLAAYTECPSMALLSGKYRRPRDIGDTARGAALLPPGAPHSSDFFTHAFKRIGARAPPKSATSAQKMFSLDDAIMTNRR